MFWKFTVSKSTALLKMEFVVAYCSKIRLLIYPTIGAMVSFWF